MSISQSCYHRPFQICRIQYRDMLSGKRDGVDANLGGMDHKQDPFCGDCSSSDLETAPQMTPSLQADLTKSWPSIKTSNTNLQFWEHEYTEHGACMVDPGVPFTQTSYFEKGHQLWGLYDVFDIFKQNKITPSQQPYKGQQLINAIKKVTKFDPLLMCKSGKGAKFVLIEVIICLDKQANKVRDCPSSKGSKASNCKATYDDIYFL